MAVLMTLDVPGGTTAMYDRSNEILGITGEQDAPPGLIAHACAVTDDGIVVMDVWHSVSSLDDFALNRLAAAFAEVGMPKASPQISPVHDLIFGAGTQPNVLVLLQAPGLTADAYDTIAARLPSHAGGGENHPAVVFVAATEPDGCRFAGLWESKAVYTEFLQRELAPAVGDPRHLVLRLWPVHSSLRVKPAATA